MGLTAERKQQVESLNLKTDLQSEGGGGKRMKKNVEAQGPDGKHQVVKQVYLES